ncbi:MAG: twin-arginine translocase TatA/TatE family subunit [Anaerolineae bacterium]|nr:twin-arginine translocase TatA/TatE family subunit [Anaerolineae bacterium]
MPTIGPLELGIILVIAIAIFGVGKIADIGKEMGRSVREFRGALREGDEAVKELGE